MTITPTQTLLPLPTNVIPRGSIDYITGTVTDRKGNNLTMPVDIALTADPSAGHTWLPATWVGTAAPEREVTTTAQVTLDGPTYPGDRYGVYVRLDNSPAHPIILIGWIVLDD